MSRATLLRPAALTFEVRRMAGTLGAGSDYVPFYHHTGIASVNAGFSSPSSAGVYHSVYDSFRWYAKFEDPDFQYGKALGDVMGRSILRMSILRA